MNSFMMDPKMMAMLGMGQGLLQASGASRLPVGMGPALRQGLQGALSNAAMAQQMRFQNERLQIARDEERRRALQPVAGGPGTAFLRPGEDSPFYTVPFPQQEPKPVGPESPLGKLAMDLKNGLINQDQFNEQYKKLVAPPQPAAVINLDQRAEGAYGVAAGKGLFERDMEQHNAAQSAVEGLQATNNLLEHLKTADANTGLAAEIKLNIDRAKVLAAQNEKAGKRVSDTELLDSMLGSQVFPMIASLGIGARGLDTPAEREFLRKVMTGTITMNRDTLVRMAEIRKNVAERAIDKFNARVDSGELDRFFQAQGTPKKKIQKPTITNVPPSSIPAAKAFPQPPQAAINQLKMSPNSRDQFDEVFGPGAAARVLGQ